MIGRRQKLIFWGLITLGLGFFVAVGLVGPDEQADLALEIPGVESFRPERGDEVLQQQAVSIDLEPGYVVRSFTISPDARCLSPVDVLAATVVSGGVNNWVYQPADGMPVARLAPDDNCVHVVIEDISRPGTTFEVEWSFTVS